MKHTTLTLIRGRGRHTRWHVTLVVGPDEFDLGSFDSAHLACAFMGRWVFGRGLAWGPDTLERLHNAYDCRDVVTFDVVRPPSRSAPR